MLVTMQIPRHITALYVFAVVNLMALFHITLVEANIMVVSKDYIILKCPEWWGEFKVFFVGLAK